MAAATAAQRGSNVIAELGTIGDAVNAAVNSIADNPIFDV